MATKRNIVAYAMKVRPIILKELISDCGIPQGKLAGPLKVSRTTINLVANRGYMPTSQPGFQRAVEETISKNPAALRWLSERGLTMADIWQPQDNPRRRQPTGHGFRSPAMRPGDPLQVTKREVEMITEDTKRFFKIFRNPFLDDVQADKDIYMSEEHRYIEAAMVDAARHAGFIAVIGEVQSGKSVIRKKVVISLQHEGNVRVIFPMIIDKDRVTAPSLCDGIIQDISSETPRMKLEDKSRQVYRLLLNRHKQGYRHVIIIEEAHDLPMKVIKLLKRFYELEDGYTKLLGIILMGQPELRDKLDEERYPDMREAIRRIQVVEIRGLNGNIHDYLTLKFKRIGAKLEDVFETDAIDALSMRLRSKDGRSGKEISHAYPGLVNNYAAKAMNLACEMGFERVSAAVVEAL
jgi:type II secretory pathway predicted ATPase ExeA